MEYPRYPNFYESLEEARHRLNRTVVLYDDLPFHINHIDKNPEEEIFDLFLSPLGLSDETKIKIFLNDLQNYYYEPSVYDPEVWKYCSDFIKNFPGEMVIKKINDPLFNYFRPFPLGMMAEGKGVVYLERVPVRPKMEQGLTTSAINMVCFHNEVNHFQYKHWNSKPFRDCILGDHDDIETVITALKKDTVENYGAPFHREFALEVDALGNLLLLYRDEIIGMLPNKDSKTAVVINEFRHYREVVEDLGIFETVDVQ